VLPILERSFPHESRPRAIIETARKFAIGKATQAELTAAQKTSLFAPRDPSVDYAQCTARDAILIAAWASTIETASIAAMVTSCDAARAAVWGSESSWDAEKAQQKELFRQMIAAEEEL
jgi:uncharacterized protein (DUF1501 family)